MRRIAVFLMLSAMPIAVAPAKAAAATVTQAAPLAASAQTDLVVSINAYRLANGRQAVAVNAALVSAAAWMATDMANRNYFSHTSSDGRSATQRMTAFGYPASSRYTGETLAAGYADAASVLAGWKASATHNSILLDPRFDAIGVGLGYSATATFKWYWVADFGGGGGSIQPVATSAPVRAPQPVAPGPGRTENISLVLVASAEDMSESAVAEVVSWRERVWQRRLDHLFAVLTRMGWL
jgi:uncharacterized protein YkwD